MKDLNGKVGVVTGGGGGIGKAIGVAMLEEGMQVVLADVLDGPLQEAVQEIGSDDLIGVTADVTSYESMCDLRDAAIAKFGGVHVICNNAGVGSGAKGNMWEHHLNDWKWSLDVNVLGIVNGINVFVPMLVEQNEGHVVNTSSGNGGFTPMVNSAIYPVTKAAVTTISECLWGQLRQIDSNVSVSILYPSSKTPGVLATGIWNAGANRPDRYSRGDDETEPAGRDALAQYIARAPRRRARRCRSRRCRKWPRCASTASRTTTSGPRTRASARRGSCGPGSSRRSTRPRPTTCSTSP